MDRFFSAVLAGVFVIIMVDGCDTGKAGSEARLDKARELFAQQEYQRSADWYRQAAADDPDSVDAWSGLARTCLQLGDIRGATDAYQQVIRSDPGHVEALLNLARFDMLAGNTTPAEEKIRQAIQAAPDDTEARFLLAELYNRTNRFSQATETYEQILPLVSDKVRALTGLARIQAKTGDPDSALKSLEGAVASAPDSIEPRLLLFNYYYGQADYQNAEKILLQAIAANPTNSELRILLGKYYYSRGQADDAEKAFLEAIKLDPGQAPVYLLAGKFYSVAKKPEEALKMFQKAVQLNPHDVKVKTLLAEFYLDNNFLREAGKSIADILDKQPGYFPARLLNIRRLLAEKDYDQAVLLSDSYLQSNPAADSLLVLKGIAHVEKGELEKAENILNEAVNLAPDNITAKLRLLDVYLKRNKIDQAQHLTRDIFGYMHKNFDVKLVLGDTELYKDKTQKGLDSLDSLSRFASANPFDRFRAEHLDSLREEYDRLMSEFSEVIEKEPKRISVFENIILLHAARHEYDIALDKCARQLERLKDEPAPAAMVHNIKGGLYLARNNIEQAKAAFEQAIILAPDFLKPYYGLAKIYIINRDIDSAINQYQTLLSRDPQQAVPYLLLGVMHKMKGDLRAAEDSYRKALAIDPVFVPAANNLAYLLAERGEDLEEALTLALRAKDLNPYDPYILDTLGWVYYKQGRYDDAVRELDLAVNLLPDSAVVNYHLGMSYYRKAGIGGQARQYLEKALQTGESLSEADDVRKLLADIY